MSSVQLASRYGPLVTRKCPDASWNARSAAHRPSASVGVTRPASAAGTCARAASSSRSARRRGRAPVTGEVEPGHAAGLGGLAREGRQAPGDRLLREGQHGPRHGRPRRRDQGGVGRARRRPVDVHLDDRHLVGELVLAEREDVGLGAQDPERHQALAQPGGGTQDRGLLGPPGEAERVEDVRRVQLGLVVELRGEHSVDDARAGALPGSDRARRAAARLERERVLGHRQARRAEVHLATVTRLGIHPAPCGEGKKAGSPSASQRSRPAGSVKPATGFQAADARSGTPTVSQPFHGKSFSLTVRGKIADPMPAWASYATFSTPPE